MKSTGLVVVACRLLALLATPTVGLAQTPADPSSPTMPAPGTYTQGAEAGVAAVVVLMAMLAIIASVHMSLWGRSAPVVKITGTVPTPELRQAAVQFVKRELSGPGSGARTEDRIVVDPLMVKRVA